MSTQYPEAADQIHEAIKEAKVHAAELISVSSRYCDLTYELAQRLRIIARMGGAVAKQAETLLARADRIDELRRMSEPGSWAMEVDRLADKAFSRLP